MEFNYIAKTKQGETQSGTVEAANRAAAVEALQARGLIILNLAGVETTPVFARSLKIFQRVKAKDLVSFARQLSTLVSAQVPLLSSLQSLAKHEENNYFQEIIFDVANDEQGGTIFSQALSRHLKVFSDFFVSMARSGEASGNL